VAQVLASLQLVDAAMLPRIEDLELLTGFGKRFNDISSASLLCSGEGSGKQAKDGVLLVWRRIWKGDYCLVMATSVKEIEAPISNQLDQIEAGASELFVTPLLLSLVCGLIICALVVVLAILMSSPLMSTARDSQQVVKNIGGDINVAAAAPASTGWLRFMEVGEVSELRGRFDRLLVELVQKRSKSTGMQNPLSDSQDARISELHAAGSQEVPGSSEPRLRFARDHGPAAGAVGGGGGGEGGGGNGNVSDIEKGRDAWETRITKWNTIGMQLRLWLILPLVVSLLVIVVYASLTMSQRANGW